MNKQDKIIITGYKGQLGFDLANELNLDEIAIKKAGNGSSLIFTNLVDYDMLYKMLLAGPVTFKMIEEATGVSHNGVAQVITTLSLRYPVWSPKRGIYKLCEASDYGDGIKRSLVKNGCN